MWGLVFVVPLLLPEYPAALLSFGRYLAFGLIALPLAVVRPRALAQLARADWLEALKLSASATCSTTCSSPAPSSAPAGRCRR